jgi:hypothetical protein
MNPTNRYREFVILALVLTIWTVRLLARQPEPRHTGADDIRVEIVSAERVQSRYVDFRARVTNSGANAVFVQDSGRGEPWVVRSLSIEKWIDGKGWVYLGPKNELPTTDVISLAPNQSMESVVELTDPIVFDDPSQKAIGIDGRFRARFLYFKSEQDWKTFSAEIQAPANSPLGTTRVKPVEIVSRPITVSSPQSGN